MKVKVTVTVDVDPESWEVEYGEDATPANVRSYCQNAVLDQLDSVGVLNR